MNGSCWQSFRAKASKTPCKIVLAEGEDPRVIEAAQRAIAERVAQPVLVGNLKRIQTMWSKTENYALPTILDVGRFSNDERQGYAAALRSISKFSTLNDSAIEERLHDGLVLGCLALKRHQVDGFVGGAVRTTADTLRAAFSIIGLKKHVSTLFGFFLIEPSVASKMETPLVLLADGAVIPEPSAKQLAQIAIYSAEAWSFFTGESPRVAFLSFSTAGSAEHPMVTKMREALALAREKAPALIMEGEWQTDAALDIFTARQKGVGASPIAGQANVLIVPDLNCGNIAYKLAQRLGGCRAVGPVLWGLAQPANDLSRGCSAEDILDMIALTAQQACATPEKNLMKAQVS